MNRTTAIMILLFAAALEAGGDAIIRMGLHMNTAWHRYVMFVAAAIILFAYGLTVNAPLGISESSWAYTSSSSS